MSGVFGGCRAISCHSEGNRRQARGRKPSRSPAAICCSTGSSISTR
ncbi:MAG: CxxxxCH/CxxCH domain-containing protein [Bauldia sp.]|nr:MAG: CxxxxCH/CxxCH domain-containing protein [Bauldia sp.]